jgi:XTP/dITP diphosphohydrolase
MSFPDVAAVASRNRGKIREILTICADWPVRWRTVENDPGPWPDIEETGSSYLENALLKARGVAGALGVPALADDSGIEVDALGGAPGPRSARFAGPRASDRDNLERLIELIRAVPEVGRSARYRCLAVLAFPEGEELIGEGTCEGTLITEPRGSEGFGYDPIFVPSGRAETMAELPAEEKDRISHRGRALRALRARLVAAAVTPDR